MSLIFNTVLPLLTLTILNYLTYQAIQKSLQLANNPPSNNAEIPDQNLRRIFSLKSMSRKTSTVTINSTNPQDGLRIHLNGENLIRKREARITKASIGITIMFLICHTPRVIPNLFEFLVDPNSFPGVSK